MNKTLTQWRQIQKLATKPLIIPNQVAKKQHKIQSTAARTIPLHSSPTMLPQQVYSKIAEAQEKYLKATFKNMIEVLREKI